VGTVYGGDGIVRVYVVQLSLRARAISIFVKTGMAPKIEVRRI